MRLTRILNHMTLLELNNFVFEKGELVEINSGCAEQILLEVKRCGRL